LDIDYPLNITVEESKAGFELQVINPGVGIPRRAVILNLPKGHRIVKFQTVIGGGIVYCHQIPGVVHGQKMFTQGTEFKDLKLALDWSRTHIELSGD